MVRPHPTKLPTPRGTSPAGVEIRQVHSATHVASSAVPRRIERVQRSPEGFASAATLCVEGGVASSRLSSPTAHLHDGGPGSFQAPLPGCRASCPSSTRLGTQEDSRPPWSPVLSSIASQRRHKSCNVMTYGLKHSSEVHSERMFIMHGVSNLALTMLRLYVETLTLRHPH